MPTVKAFALPIGTILTLRMETMQKMAYPPGRPWSEPGIDREWTNDDADHFISRGATVLREGY